MNLPSKQPLSGIRVLEFGQIAAGPYTGMLLADLGADVVKVENPNGGDGMRLWPPFVQNEEEEEYSANFSSLNRNKRSICIDFKDKQQLATLRELCLQADVIIENFRPGVLKKFALDYESLSSVHPKLIYCSISGYGQEGPYANKGAFDVTVQAISGLMSVTGEEDGEAVKCGVPVADFAVGLYAAYTITAAVLNVEKGGEGTQIDCSMLGSVLGISALQTSEYFGNKQSPKRLGTAHPRNAPYQGFYGSDKPFVIAAGNNKLWKEVCEATGLEELFTDPRFVNQTARAKNQKELAALLQKVFSTKPAESWIAEFDQRGVPSATVNDFSEALASPMAQSLNIVRDLPLPNGSSIPTVGFPVKVKGYEFSVYRKPPLLGEHTNEVLQEWKKLSIKV
ncbi:MULTISPECIES: CaiB/BaiF CoA transferase family protein [Priestia]|jgi:crotonobetainyl-CoA:carnitine CoA-transferase CaiB-like acyl-CoA transferase|uniref:CaiB/BaiF CoA transferase family protein n=1 Tax=Priestia TaxID=2800373 RepID=UPI000BED7F52|nr:CoA transferase [Priestia megaterium]PEE73609.1 carnitine dehydratase [Priestia megaterium]PFI82011.1 carnitine dehydratase [Priestia megaterium]PGR03936.1 carnitine dehydratase [Priestia megaterium]